MDDQFLPFDAAAILLRCAFPVNEEAPCGWHELLSATARGAGLDGYVQFGSDLAALRSRLIRFALSLGCNPAEAEDLAQDTLMRAWAGRAQFELGTNLRAWTFTILRNRWLSARRRDRFNGEYDESIAEAVLRSDEQQSGYVELSEVLQAIRLLPEDQHAAFQAVVLQGLSYERAAECLDVPLGTLKSRVSRGRASLKVLLERRGEPSYTVPEPDLHPESVPAEVSKPPIVVARRSAWADAKASGRPLIIG